MDVHVRRAITIASLDRGIDVLTAQIDGAGELDDPALLDRATMLNRVLFSQNQDLLIEETRRQRSAIPFAGVIYAHQLYVTIGRCISDLELIAKLCAPEDLANRVEFLPL
jgi:hypothetical protein